MVLYSTSGHHAGFWASYVVYNFLRMSTASLSLSDTADTKRPMSTLYPGIRGLGLGSAVVRRTVMAMCPSMGVPQHLLLESSTDTPPDPFVLPISSSDSPGPHILFNAHMCF